MSRQNTVSVMRLALMMMVLGGVMVGCGSQAYDDQDAGRPVVIVATIGPGTARDEHVRRFSVDLARMQGLGRVNLQIQGQLGGEETLISALRRGRAQMGVVSALSMSTMLPELALLYAPFLFDSYEQADRVLCGPLADAVVTLVQEHQLQFLGWSEIGFHHVYSKDARSSPEQFQGVRFRVSAGPAALAFPQALGADAIPIGFADVVPALQTGLIHAGENGIEPYLHTGIADYATHLVMTGHAYGTSLVVANLSWWQSLPESTRQQIADVLPVSISERREIRQRQSLDLDDAVREKGVELHVPSATALESWYEVGYSARGRLLKSIDDAGGSEFWQVIQAAIAAREGPAPVSDQALCGPGL